jgi:hypothetical protein
MLGRTVQKLRVMARIDDPESDLTRKQRREQARAERRALEEAQREAADNRKRLTQIAGGAIVVVVVAVIVVLIASSGGSKKAATTSAGGSGAEAGLLATPAPWPPQYSGLLTRVVSAHFPPQSDVGYHVHAVLRIYVEGKQVEVPSQIGIDQQEGYLAPLHTHDSSGIIHMEATEPYPFKLSQFFTVWGVKFTNSQLGAYRAGNGKALALYANGTQVARPTEYAMKPHDRLALDYGDPKSFVKEYSFTFPSGL